MQSPAPALRAVFGSTFLLLLSLFAVEPAHAATTGEQKTAVILINFQDGATQPITPAAANSLVFGTVSDFYWEASYQKTFFSGNTYGWFTIPVSKAICDVNVVAQEADKAAIAAGVNLAAYDRLVYLAPQNSCTSTGYNSGPALPSRTWIFTDLYNARIIAHELGHNFNLSHSQALDCGATTLGSNCTNYSYGDPSDTMGSGSTPHFNAFQKEQLGWLNTPGQPPITTVSTSGTYTIAPLATMGTTSKALKIARGVDASSGQMSYYYIEYRQPVGFDTVLGSTGNLAAGVVVHTGGAKQFSMLLDMTPDSDTTSWFNDVRDSALTVGRTYVDSAAGVSFKLLSADASGATVEVSMGGSTPPPTCTRAAPTLSVSGPTAPVAPGSTLTYTVSLVNHDSSACSATTFALAKSLPSGWSGALASGSLSLSPGASGSTTYSVTSPGTATAGSYALGAGASSSVGSVHTANAAATYSVAGTAAALTESLGTDKSSYLRNDLVSMSALVKNNAVVVNGASVKFTLTLPSGATTTINATSGSDGYARATYRIGKSKTAIGTYTLRADATSSGSTVSASTTFSAR